MDHTSCVLGVVKLSTKVAKKIKGKKKEEGAQSKTMQLSKAKFRENAAGQKFLQP